MTRRAGTLRTVPRWAAAALLASASVGAAACTDDDTGSEEAFCEQVVNTPELATVIAGFANVSPVELDNRLDDAADAYAELRSSAPGEIDDEVDTMVDLVDAVIGAVRANPADQVAAADQVRSVMAEHPDASAAQRAVVDYAAEACGTQLGTTTVPDP